MYPEKRELAARSCATVARGRHVHISPKNDGEQRRVAETGRGMATARAVDAHPAFVAAGLDALGARERRVEREPWGRHEDVRAFVTECTDREVKGARAAAGDDDVLRCEWGILAGVHVGDSLPGLLVPGGPGIAVPLGLAHRLHQRFDGDVGGRIVAELRGVLQVIIFGHNINRQRSAVQHVPADSARVCRPNIPPPRRPARAAERSAAHGEKPNSVRRHKPDKQVKTYADRQWDHLLVRVRLDHHRVDQIPDRVDEPLRHDRGRHSPLIAVRRRLQ